MLSEEIFIYYLYTWYRIRYSGGQEIRCYEWCYWEEGVGPRKKMQLEIHGFETLLIAQRISYKQGARYKVEVQEPALGRFYSVPGYGCAGCQNLYHLQRQRGLRPGLDPGPELGLGQGPELGPRADVPKLKGNGQSLSRV